MALYRTIQTSFWSDTKIAEDFTPEDRYFYLYLFSNPHTNLCGCYEVGKRQIAYEIGYSTEAVERLLERFSDIHRVIAYDKETKEILILKWYKYNWTRSPDYRKALLKSIEGVKNPHFKEYLMNIYDGANTISTPSSDGGGTSNTITNTNTITNSNTNKAKKHFENEELNEAFKNYIEMRKKIKRPMTDEAIKRAKSKLENLAGNDDEKKIAIINQSIDKSWNGLFELPKAKQESPPPQNEDKLRELEEMYL